MRAAMVATVVLVLLSWTWTAPTAVVADPIMWSGGITSSSAAIRVHIDGGTDTLYVATSTEQLSATGAVWQATLHGPGVAAATVTGLSTDTQYFYAVASATSLVGKFRTLPQEGSAANFTVAFASCACTGYDSPVFDDIAALQPAMFLHMGDLHYANIDTNSVEVRNQSFYDVFASPTQAGMFRSVPVAYMWDDHDFGPNNSGGTFVGKEVARIAYQQFVPHYPLQAGTGNVPLQQAFTIGRVRFLLTDLRSEAAMPDALNTTMGYPQRAWFVNELKQYNNYAMVVWINTKPWVGESDPDSDRWAGFPTEREYLANKMKEIGIDNLVVLSGDAHVLAMDDGSHTDYATNGGAGFPLFHAAPMAQYGSNKGMAPFTHGCESYRYYMTHQYGVMSVEDTGSTTCFTWKGYRLGVKDAMLQYRTCTPVMKSGVAGGDACPIALVPQWVFTMGILVLLTLFTVGAGTCIACCSRMRARAAARKYASDKSRKSSIGGNGSGRSSDIEMSKLPRDSSIVANPLRYNTLQPSTSTDSKSSM